MRHTFRNLRSRIKQINIGNRIINSRVFIYYYIFRFSFHFISLEYLVDFHFFYIWVGLGGIFRLFYLLFSSSTWIVINNVFFLRFIILYYYYYFFTKKNYPSAPTLPNTAGIGFYFRFISSYIKITIYYLL